MTTFLILAGIAFLIVAIKFGWVVILFDVLSDILTSIFD